VQLQETVLGKCFLLILAFSVCVTSVSARDNVPQKTDSLITILEDGGDQQSDRLIHYLFLRFLYSSAPDSTERYTRYNIRKYMSSEATGLIYFMNSLVYNRRLQYDLAKYNLLKAIETGQHSDSKVLLFNCYTNLALIYTTEGNLIDAIHAFKVARKHSTILMDNAALARNALGISIIYNQIELYERALHYLNEAEVTANALPVDHIMLDSYINYNKAEVYFKLGIKDSLIKYTQLMAKQDTDIYGLAYLRTRTKYFKKMLDGKYTESIQLIKSVVAQQRTDQIFDSWNLANVYYSLNNFEAARNTLEQIIRQNKYTSSQMKFNVLRLLAQIAAEKNDIVTANLLNKQAMLERDSYVKQLIQAGDIAEQLRLEEMETSYHDRTLLIERQRDLLFIAIAFVVLLLVIIALLYRNVKQKNIYEKLLNDAHNMELSAINSHQVRRHLANILGICHYLEDTEGVGEEVRTFHKHLLNSAIELDESLRVVEEKLNRNVD
jgi:tetratricopeptide (TPR) repeat protein